MSWYIIQKNCFFNETVNSKHVLYQPVLLQKSTSIKLLKLLTKSQSGKGKTSTLKLIRLTNLMETEVKTEFNYFDGKHFCLVRQTVGRHDIRHNDTQHNGTQGNNKNTTQTKLHAEFLVCWGPRFYCYAGYRSVECCPDCHYAECINSGCHFYDYQFCWLAICRLSLSW